MSIRELEAEVLRLKNELNGAESRLREAKIAVSGISVGDVVQVRGKRFRVTQIDPRPWSDGKPWLKGNPERADGTFGTAIRHLFADWQPHVSEVRGAD